MGLGGSSPSYRDKSLGPPPPTSPPTIFRTNNEEKPEVEEAHGEPLGLDPASPLAYISIDHPRKFKILQ
jgi:hypothetical protein